MGYRELPVGVRQSKQTENWPRSCRLKENRKAAVSKTADDFLRRAGREPTV